MGTIFHQKIADYFAKKTRILVFPSLVMLLCQQRGIVPRAGEKILESKGPVNESFVERMTQGKDTPILKEAETNKKRKGKAKADRRGTNLNAETPLWRTLKDVQKMVNSINNRQIKLVTTVKDIERSHNLFYDYTRAWNSSIVPTLSQLSSSPLPEFPIPVASPLLVQVSDTEKDKESRDIEECLRKIDSLFEDGIFADHEDIVVEKEVATAEEKVLAEDKVVAEEEKVAENEKEKRRRIFC
ncbi:hypothetical protein PVK06_012050 [Gossypium arboreum]|uniref:Uncharacterized protein n=1 Tax=Gossypium arboreum TaxID=29729 RepID=A0ABR0QAK1_GOSAR|nr:hypothetical protein PVK06_012050 [Gossypium arboreum]